MRATVIIPTFDHGPLLKYSVGSALRQTVSDIEIFIVGDGVPAEHRDVVNALVRSDPRIRFFDFEKGPRNGEVWRNRAIGDASGRIICYLSDDDLWMPDHVEVMDELLRDADFASTLPVHIDVRGGVNTYIADIAHPGYQSLFHEGHNRVPLSCAAHTMVLFRRSAGWRTTPEGTPTDLYMWQELLRTSPDRARSGFRPTAINFPSPVRRDWTLEQREQELRAWGERISAPGAARNLHLRVIESQARLAARSFLETRELAARVLSAEAKIAGSLADDDSRAQHQRELEECAREASQSALQATAKLREVEAGIAHLKAEATDLRARLARTAIEREAAERLVERHRQELDASTAELHRVEMINHEMANTVTWRLRERFTKPSLTAHAARWVARALARSKDR